MLSRVEELELRVSRNSSRLGSDKGVYTKCGLTGIGF